MKPKTTNHWLILAFLALAQFMVILDVSIVNIMLPTVQTSFHMSQTSLQWVITIYTLAFGGFLLLGGRMADLFGRRRVFLTSLALFSTISLLDGMSQSGGMLITLRAFQGLAGAFMSPAALSIVLVTYKEGHARNVALSVWGAVASSGAAVGLLLGGIITEYLGWRWNFFINVPIGLIAFFGTYRLIPKHESEETHRDLDFPGAVMVTGSLMFLVYAFTKAPTIGWTDHTTLWYLFGSLALMAGFIINEARVTHPLLTFSIFKLRNVTGANLVQITMAAALFSVFFLATLYLQLILGYSPVKTGLSFLALPFSIGITASITPKLIKKIGFKPLLVAGPLISGVGLYVLAQTPVQGHYMSDILPGFSVLGLGLGFTFVSTLVAATSGVPGKLSGLASGLINTTQQIGGSLGLAILSGISGSSTARYIAHLHPKVVSESIVQKATVHGFHAGYYVALCFTIAAAISAALVTKQTSTTEPAADQ